MDNETNIDTDTDNNIDDGLDLLSSIPLLWMNKRYISLKNL